MNPQIPSPPQKKSDFSKSPASPAMMEMIKRKGQPKSTPEVEKAKQQIKSAMQKYNVSPDTVIQIGEMAKQSVSKPVIYQMLIQKATQTGLISQNEIKPSKNGMDLRLIAAAITLGKLAEMIKKEG
jgi:hypothetical protein